MNNQNNLSKKRRGIIAIAVFSLSLVLLEIPINPIQEAQAFQAVTVTTSTAVSALQESYSYLDGRWVYVDMEGLTQVRVIDANSSSLIRTFNMSTSLMNGFNIQYKFLGMDCNPTLSICVAGYTTQNTGSCSGGTSACMDRVVMFNIANGVYTGLSRGYNYTHGTNTLNTVNFSYGFTQFNIFANYKPTAGGTSKIDTLVFNSTDSVASHPLVFGNTFDTTGNVNYVLSRLGTFTVGGVLTNYEGMTQAGVGQFITFNRSTNGFGCSVNLGGNIKDFAYSNDTAGVNWWIVGGTGQTVINKVNSACTSIASVDLTASSGGNALLSISINPVRKEIYVASSSKLFVVNETSLSTTPILTMSLVSNPCNAGCIASYSQNVNTANVASGTGASQIQVFYWNFQGSNGGGQSGGTTTVCLDINPKGSVANLVCFTCPAAFGSSQAISAQCPHGYPTPNPSGVAPFVGFYNGSQSLGVWGCATGWFSCANQNPVTNGLGYAFLAIIITLSAMGLMYVVYKTNHSPQDVVLPIALVSILECGAFWQMNLTSSIPFFVGILGMIGLGAFKIYQRVAN